MLHFTLKGSDPNFNLNGILAVGKWGDGDKGEVWTQVFSRPRETFGLDSGTQKFIFARMPSVFIRIINRDLPAKIFYETDHIIVIADHRPKDRCHLLIIPKTEYPDFQRTPPEVLTLMSEIAKLIARKLGIEGHYRLLVNNGYGQEVPHVHFHFMSDRGADKLVYLP